MPSGGRAALMSRLTRRRANGFTLVEVMVALGIVAIALAAGMRAAGQLVNNAERDGLHTALPE